MKITKENNVSCPRCGEKHNIVLIENNSFVNTKTYGCESCSNVFKITEPNREYNPDTKEFDMELRHNQLLFTKDGRNFSNCIVTNVLKKEGSKIVYGLKSDYGNEFNLVAKEIDSHFYIGSIADYDHKNYVNYVGKLNNGYQTINY